MRSKSVQYVIVLSRKERCLQIHHPLYVYFCLSRQKWRMKNHSESKEIPQIPLPKNPLLPMHFKGTKHQYKDGLYPLDRPKFCTRKSMIKNISESIQICEVSNASIIRILYPTEWNTNPFQNERNLHKSRILAWTVFDHQGLARPEFKFVKNCDFAECSEWNLCFGCYGLSGI